MSLPKEYKEIELASLCAAVKSAGEEILRIYATDFDVEIKGDDSPLTAADQAANKVLMDYVTEHTPNIPVISEENKEVHYNDRKDWNRFWLIDPLDGTKDFCGLGARRLRIVGHNRNSALDHVGERRT